MKIIKTSFVLLMLSAYLAGCGFFDDARELAQQLEYYKKYARSLEEKISGLNNIIGNLKNENNNLKNQLKKYQEAHRKMLQ